MDASPQASLLATACPACIELFDPDNLLPLGCSHAFCRDCTARLVREHAPLPICPMPGCGTDVTAKYVEEFVGDLGLQNYNDALLQRALQEMPDRVECPNRSCTNVVVTSSGVGRSCYSCACGHPPFCTHCRQLYHYHADCASVQILRESWIDWLSHGRAQYSDKQVSFEAFAKERAETLQVASQRHKELLDDERYKELHCRLCPNCFRPVEKVAGCNSMVCGQNAHGGNQQSGCGNKFNWDHAPKYRATVATQSLASMGTIGSTGLSGAGYRHLFSHCAICTQMIRGPMLRCIHCPCFEVCLQCEDRALGPPNPHSADHVFEILYEPSEPAIEDLPRGTKVSVFGMDGAAAVLNDCTAQVWRYSTEHKMYELKFSNGARPVVPIRNVQPDVEDAAQAREALESALCQAEIRHGFHLGVCIGSSVQVVGGQSELGVEAMQFDPTAQVLSYDPLRGQYRLAADEPLQWPCERCTLLNEPNVLRCGACNSARPAGYGEILVDVKCIHPLIHQSNDAKTIAQRHWKETQRLLDVMKACDAAKYCHLDLPKDQLVEYRCNGEKNYYATVQSYEGDGTYLIHREGEESGKRHQVNAELLTPMFHNDQNPLQSAGSIVEKHRQESERLPLAMEANKLQYDCNLDIPEDFLVLWTGNSKSTKDSARGTVRSYLKDGTYYISMLDNQPCSASSSKEFHAPAAELKPLFFKTENPVASAELIAERHSREQKRLDSLERMHAQIKSANLDIPEQSMVKWVSDGDSLTGNTIAIVDRYWRDGTYTIHIRDAQKSTGLLTSSKSISHASFIATAAQLEPLLYQYDTPELVAPDRIATHEAEQRRLFIAEEVNEFGQSYNLDIPAKSLVKWLSKDGPKPAHVELHGRDGMYVISLRGSARKEDKFWVSATELQPLFFEEAEPREALKRRIARHDLEKQCLETARNANVVARHCHHGLMEGSYARWTASSNCDKVCKVEHCNLDGTYIIELRNILGSFGGKEMRRHVLAAELEPIFFWAESPEFAAQVVMSNHELDKARLRECQIANEMARGLTANLPIGTLVQISATSQGACQHNGLAKIVRRFFARDVRPRIDRNVASKAPSLCYEVDIDYFICEQAVRRFQFVASELTPVFWHEGCPHVAAKRVASLHRDALMKTLFRDIYRSSCLHDLQAMEKKRELLPFVALTKYTTLPADASLQRLGLVRGESVEAIRVDCPLNLAQRHCLPAVLRGDDVTMFDKSCDHRMHLLSFLQGFLFRFDAGVHHPQCLLVLERHEPAVVALIRECLELSSPLSSENRPIVYDCMEGGEKASQAADRLKGSHVIIATLNCWAVVSNLSSENLCHLTSLILYDVDASGRHLQTYSQLLSNIPSQTQLLCSSQTISADLQSISCRCGRNTVMITADDNEPKFENVRHFYCAVEKEEWKLDTVCDLIEMDATSCLVLCKDERTCDYLVAQLAARDFASARLHSDLSAEGRAHALRQFASGVERLLIASYISTGYADVQANAYVVLYDLPEDPEQYLYAIGRRDRRRDGRESIAIAFVTNDCSERFRSIERYHGFVGPRAIEELPMDIFDMM